MRATLTGVKPMSLMIASVAVASTAVVGVSLAASPKGDFTLSAGPATVSVTQGQGATFSVTENTSGGFSDAVTLGVSGIPSGATATFSPNPVVKGSTTATLTIDTSTSATTGPSGVTLTINGTSSSTAATPRQATVKLVVNPNPQPAFNLAASPSTLTRLPGDSATYTVMATRPTPPNYAGSIALSVASGLPTGVTATLSQTALSTTSPSSTLTVATKNNTPGGNYTVVVNGTGSGQTQSASVTLSVSGTGKPFPMTLAKPITDLSPGRTLPIDLLLTDPNSQPMQITSLTVTIDSVSKSAAAPSGRTCTPSDYTITPFSGTYGFTVQPGPAVALSSLVPAAALPTITMNDPQVNQDGCKGASIHLVFAGAGQG